MDPSLLQVPTGTEILGYAAVRDNRTGKQRVVAVDALQLMIGDRGGVPDCVVLIGDISGCMVRGSDSLEVNIPGKVLDLTWQHPYSHRNSDLAGVIDNLIQDREGQYRNPRLTGAAANPPPQPEQYQQQQQQQQQQTRKLAVPLMLIPKPNHITNEFLWPQVPDPVELAFWDNYTNQVSGYQPRLPCNVPQAAAYFHSYLETYDVKMKVSFPGMKSIRFLCSQQFHDQVVHMAMQFSGSVASSDSVLISTSSVVDLRLPFVDWENSVASWNASQNLHRSVYVSSVEYERSKGAASSSSGAVPSTTSDPPSRTQSSPQGGYYQNQQKAMPHHWTPPKQPRGVCGKI
eukprot:TRINITY_DN6257_c4_g1_i1.p1 TRINITY_DN6257_c4_g1~~TRINITY_DN6257_c4_g1_i1.p1  ORF type:complete len:345 (+),score=64.82 TRINITY_DN6257_c4_g1_i1:55-1089(+)